MLHDPDAITRELPALRRFALALSRDESEAEDLVQEALLRGHEQRRSFRAGGNMKGWLFAILRNVFIDRRRSRQSQARREAAVAAHAEVMVDAPQEAALRLSQLREAFFLLPDDQREALSLVALEGLTYAEAAQLTGVPLGTLMSRIGRARAALRAFEAGENPAALKLVGGRDANRS